MSYQCEFTDREGLLQVDAWGSLDNFKDLAGFTEAILVEAERLGSSRILLQEQKLSIHTSCFDAVIVAKELKKSLGNSPRRQVAVVYSPDYEYICRVVETVFLNRGFKYRMFPDVESASQWLGA